MDKKLAELAKLYAHALVICYSMPAGDANSVPAERRAARKQAQELLALLSKRAQEVAQKG